MVYVDVHSHMDWESLRENLSEIVDSMRNNNIITLSNTINQKTYIETKELFKQEKQVKVCPGLYPQDAEEINDNEFNEYLEVIELDIENIVAIGEVGLDFHHTKREEVNKIEMQVRRFRQVLEFAYKLDKPVIVHTRAAEKEVLEILEEFKVAGKIPKVCLHCFMGKKKYIAKIKELGLYCSIPLIVKNNESFRNLVAEMPIKYLLAETDSPFLHPDKIQNNPNYILGVYEEIAEIKGLDKTEIENIIYRNYMKFIM